MDEEASERDVSEQVESFYDSSSGRWIDIGPVPGTLVRFKHLACCGLGGEHEGHEARCYVLPPGKAMSTDDYPHEHDHHKVESGQRDGVWEVVGQDQGAGVYIRRISDKTTALADPEQIRLDVRPVA